MEVFSLNLYVTFDDMILITSYGHNSPLWYLLSKTLHPYEVLTNDQPEGKFEWFR